jgi:hypothetical protein
MLSSRNRYGRFNAMATGADATVVNTPPVARRNCALPALLTATE